MKKILLSLCSAVFLFALATVAAVNYELLNKVPVPGTGGWDYVTVDATARRVYISHSTQVDVLDADSFALVGTVPNTPGVHGIAIAPEAGRGYISAGKADKAIAFDLKTLKPLGEISVGKKPDAIIYEPLTKRIYVMNGDSDNITVLNAADGAQVGNIPLGGGPEFAVSDGKGKSQGQGRGQKKRGKWVGVAGRKTETDPGPFRAVPDCLSSSSRARVSPTSPGAAR